MRTHRRDRGVERDLGILIGAELDGAGGVAR